MELDDLRQLEADDQRTFLLGRVASETIRMDATLRFLHAALRRDGNTDAFLDTPASFSATASECIARLPEHDLTADVVHALRSSIEAARAAYSQRNRFMHDMLREDLLSPEWELVPLSRPTRDRPGIVPASFDGIVELVIELVACTWRLRGAAIYVYQRGWDAFALGEVTGNWDGSADASR